MHAHAHAAALGAFAAVQGTNVAAQAKHKSPRPVTRSFMRQRSLFPVFICTTNKSCEYCLDNEEIIPYSSVF